MADNVRYLDPVLRSRQVDAELRALIEGCQKLNEETIAIQQEEIRKLEGEVARLKRGEFICRSCGLRKDAEHDHAEF